MTWIMWIMHFNLINIVILLLKCIFCLNIIIFYSITCHQSIQRICLRLLCSSYRFLYNKPGEHFLHFCRLCRKFIHCCYHWTQPGGIRTRFTNSWVIFQADVVADGKRAAAFSWITGLFSASHVVGNMLARFLPEDYIFEVCLCCYLFSIFYQSLTCLFIWPYFQFQVSIALLIFVPVYMTLFLTETVKPTQKPDHHISCLNKAIKIVKERYYSMKHAVHVVTSR